MNTYNTMVCIPMIPNQRPGSILILNGITYGLIGQKDNQWCYQPIAFGMGNKQKCPSICIVGTSNQPPDSPPTIPCTGTTQSLQGASNSIAYDNQLFALGGTSPHDFTISAGSLPPEFTLSSSGLISYDGMSPSIDGTYTFTVRVTDNRGCTGTQTFTLTVTSA